jgi:hypothetical protein
MTRGFRLRLSERDVRRWAARYDDSVDTLVEDVGRKARERGHLTAGELRILARWKTPRSAPQVARNDDGFVAETTRVALSTRAPRLRIEVLTLLDGVHWPTASVILHFAHREPHPILDVRALWSLGVSPAPAYAFPFWERYLAFTRALARRLRVSMRDLDRALWQYSKEKQTK